MEKKSSGIATKSSDRLIDKLLTKLRMIKRSSNSSMANARPSIEYKPAGSSGQQDYHQYDWHYRKISPEDLMPFCEQLGKFLKYVQSIQELTYLTYDYPSMLQKRLEKDAHDLESMFLEVKDAVNNISRIKSQSKSVKKEKSAVKKTLKKLREDEVREMENIVSLYDKAMFSRWENVKNTHKPEVLEILLHDITGKQKALVNLTTLVNRKLSQLQIFMPMASSAETPAPATGVGATTNTNAPDNSATPVTTPTTPTSTTTTAITISPTVSITEEDRQVNSTVVRRYHGVGSSARSSSYRRRRHQERQDSHMGSRFGALPLPDSSSTNLPLVPFSVGPSAFQFLNSGSNHSLVTAASSANTTNIVRNNESNNSSVNANNVGSEFQSEMRTVLQALFGELRQNTTAAIAINNTIDTNENTSNQNREIELYTLRRSN